MFSRCFYIEDAFQMNCFLTDILETYASYLAFEKSSKDSG